MMLYVVLCLLFVTFVAGSEVVDDKTQINDLESWQKMFRLKRSQQLVAVKNLLNDDNVQNRQKMLKLLTEAMQKVITDGRHLLTKSGFEPGMNFPKDAEQKEALSRILENTAFFGDLALHFPDFTSKLYKRDDNLQSLIRWSVEFSNKTMFYDDQTRTLMYLLSQELQLVDRDDNYINPYRNAYKEEQQRLNDQTKQEAKMSQKKKAKKLKKGPKMSGGKLEL